VDAGQNKKHILKLLNQEHLPNRHINLLVCTHYDADHIRGIVGILEPCEISFDEIWVPEVLGSMSYTVSEDLIGILQRLRNLEQDSIADLIRKAGDAPRSDASTSIAEDSPIKTANLDDLKNALVSSTVSEYLLWSALGLRLWPIASQLPVQLMLANLSAAITVVSASLSSGARVRWFKYLNRQTNGSCGFGMYSMNAIETAVTLYSPDVFLEKLYLTTINIESLVFKFSYPECPDILFCADSDLSFAMSPIQLKDESVVTAPHHGSGSCDHAYSLISGSGLIYVRSDRSQTTRPGTGFLLQANRYCTICRNMGPKQKVDVFYRGGLPTVTAKPCRC